MSTDSPDPQFSGPVDFDLPCLQCGYDLRGLFGDPVRCPECGYDNPVIGDYVPPDELRRQLRQLETPLAACTLIMIFIFPSLLGFIGVVADIAEGGSGDGGMCSLSLLIALIVAWAYFYNGFRVSCRGTSNWQKMFWGYQVRSLLLCTVVFAPGLAVMVWLDSSSCLMRNDVGRAIASSPVLGYTTTAMLALVAWPLRAWHRKYWSRFEPMLREVALERARHDIHQRRNRSPQRPSQEYKTPKLPTQNDSAQ